MVSEEEKRRGKCQEILIKFQRASQKAGKHPGIAHWGPTTPQTHVSLFWGAILLFCKVVQFIFSLGVFTVKTVAGEIFLEDFWSALMEYTDFCHCKQYFAFKSDSETLVSESMINS